MKRVLLLSYILLCVACSSPKMSISQAHPLEHKHISYDSWGKAINDADFVIARQMTEKESDLNIIQGFEALYNSDAHKARDIFEGVKSEEHQYLESLMLPYYFHHGRHKECAELASHVGNDRYSLSKIISERPATKMSWGEEFVTLPIISYNYGGTPIIEVVINDKKLKFIVDTGCSHTIISEKTARACGIPLLQESIPMSDVNQSITEASAAIIDNLSLGGLSISHQLAYVVKKLSMNFLGISFSKMDGILGWDILQQLKVQINWADDYIRLSKSDLTKVGQPNLYAITSPFVIIRDRQGISYFFHFDTGAKQTELFQKALEKGEYQYSKGRKRISFGINSTKRIRTNIVKDLTLNLGDHSFNLEKIKAIEERAISGFVRLDGRLGTDLFKKGAIEFDYQAGYLRYIDK